MTRKGFEAERLAVHYLKNKGYEVVKQNFYSRFGEIDIVAIHKKVTVFVEVKMRSNDIFGSPLESITQKKLRKLKKTAEYFLLQNRLQNEPFRFDAIEVTVKNGKTVINQVENITL